MKTPKKRGSGWLRGLALLGAMLLTLGIAGCCLDDGEACDSDADCCSDICEYDSYVDDNVCVPD